MGIERFPFFLLIFVLLNVTIMDLRKAKHLAESLMDKHLVDCENYWVFEFDNAKKRFGMCKWGRRGYIISLSRHLTLLNNEKEVRDTILHEIAHALDVNERGYSNHDANWRRIALSIGCDGERCYDSTEVAQPPSKYKVVCDNCGRETESMRKPKRYSKACGRCCKAHNGGKYDEKYKLRYIQNY
jgi:predicted SprT family Zn-dependent metalloprotease